MQYEFLKSSKLSVGSTIVHSTGEYTIRDNLGKGAFGEVYKVTNSSNNTYALKLLHYKTPWELEKAKKEAAMLKSLNHRNIISYVNSFAVEGGHYIIVTEYCAQGSLKDVLYSMGSREGDEGVCFLYPITYFDYSLLWATILPLLWLLLTYFWK